MSRKCRKRTRAGTPCGQTAGWGTDHVGEGPCKLHGGATPVVHGLRSKFNRPVPARIRQVLETLQEDEEPTNLIPEVLLIRAIAHDYLDRHEEIVEALLEWNQQEFAERGDFARPQRIPSFHEASILFERVSRVVERIQKRDAQRSIPLSTVAKLIQQLGLIVARHVKDPSLLDAIEKDWREVQVA